MTTMFEGKGTGALQRLRGRLRSEAGRFRREEKGAVVIMTAFTILIATVIIGGSIDIYRYEMLRKKAQYTLDRGVLAAASLSQSIDDSEKIVRSYMKVAGLEMPAGAKFRSCPADGKAVCCPLEDASRQTACNDDWNTYKKSYRSVEVATSYDLPLTFLRLPAGFLPKPTRTTWTVPVQASAVERENNVEVSLVLDISGSMRFSVNGPHARRIDALRPPAVDFVRQLLGTEEARATTSISLVPYAGQVNMGRPMFEHLGINRRHEYSSCVHFTDDDYELGMPNLGARTQVGH